MSCQHDVQSRKLRGFQLRVFPGLCFGDRQSPLQKAASSHAQVRVDVQHRPLYLIVR